MNLIKEYNITKFDSLILEKLFNHDLNEYNDLLIINYINEKLKLGKINLSSSDVASLSQYYSNNIKVQNVIDDLKIKLIF